MPNAWSHPRDGDEQKRADCVDAPERGTARRKARPERMTNHVSAIDPRPSHEVLSPSRRAPRPRRDEEVGQQGWRAGEVPNGDHAWENPIRQTDGHGRHGQPRWTSASAAAAHTPSALASVVLPAWDSAVAAAVVTLVVSRMATSSDACCGRPSGPSLAVHRHRRDRRRRVGVALADRPRLFTRLRRQQVSRTSAAEGRLPCQHLVRQHAERVPSAR